MKKPAFNTLYAAALFLLAAASTAKASEEMVVSTDAASDPGIYIGGAGLTWGTRAAHKAAQEPLPRLNTGGRAGPVLAPKRAVRRRPADQSANLLKLIQDAADSAGTPRSVPSILLAGSDVTTISNVARIGTKPTPAPKGLGMALCRLATTNDALIASLVLGTLGQFPWGGFDIGINGKTTLFRFRIADIAAINLATDTAEQELMFHKMMLNSTDNNGATLKSLGFRGTFQPRMFAAPYGVVLTNGLWYLK